MLAATATRWSRSRLRNGVPLEEVFAIPVDRTPQPILHSDLGLPARGRPELGRVDPLAVDLAARSAAPPDLRRYTGAGQLADELGDLEHRPRLAGPCVERLAGRPAVVE